jgi:hypothetical protein
MGINLIEAVYLLKELQIESVKVDALINVFLKPATEATDQQEQTPELPELPEPPAPQPQYKTYAEAKKAAQKGQTPVKEGDGYVLV